MDIEGGEFNALKGATDLLASKNAPLIVFESAKWAERRLSEEYVGASQKFLKNFGYEIFALSDFIRTKNPIPYSKSEDYLMLVAVKK